MMEIVINDQHIRVLSAVPSSAVETPPLPGAGGVATAPQAQQRSVVVQCFRPGTSGNARAPQEGPRPILVLQGPPKPGGPSWEAVEVIRRVPVARETKPDPPGLSTLLELKEEEEEEEVEIILTPVESLSEPALAGHAP
ncbi:hypothetical protein AAFF_G00220850 [Aldrovandia affinis]|uniref:Uncharacterized protein n=1 Tax=Aldrovandia affinis TaxID=143900 RepID=A0AAD7W4S9_9TELE|nr:hypothetical protein AAFF_G00220850 [Aldrovandia affinis]